MVQRTSTAYSRLHSGISLTSNISRFSIYISQDVSNTASSWLFYTKTFTTIISMVAYLSLLFLFVLFYGLGCNALWYEQRRILAMPYHIAHLRAAYII